MPASAIVSVSAFQDFFWSPANLTSKKFMNHQVAPSILDAYLIRTTEVQEGLPMPISRQCELPL